MVCKQSPTSEMFNASKVSKLNFGNRVFMKCKTWLLPHLSPWYLGNDSLSYTVSKSFWFMVILVSWKMWEKSRRLGVILLNPGSTFLHITNEIYHWILSVQLYIDCYQLFDIYTTFHRDLLLIQLQTLKCLYFYQFSRNIFIFTFLFDLTSFGVEVRFHQILCDPSERNLIFTSENWKNSSPLCSWGC